MSNLNMSKLQISQFFIPAREFDFHFNIIGITETRIKNNYANLDFSPTIPNYNFEYAPNIAK